MNSSFGTHLDKPQLCCGGGDGASLPKYIFVMGTIGLKQSQFVFIIGIGGFSNNWFIFIINTGSDELPSP